MARARSSGAAGRYLREEGGFVLVFLAVAMPALVGLVGLAIDGTRLTTLDSDLAGLADSTALAAADRLDRSDGAIPSGRAAAAAVLARGAASIGLGAPRLAIRFAADLADLRGNPAYSLPEPGGAAANLVEVTVQGSPLVTSFLQLVGAAPPPIRRSAVAESQYYACDVTPAVMCHADPADFAARARPGRQYLLRMDGNRVQGSVVPLDRRDRPGGRQTLVNLASTAPGFCFSDGVRLRTTIAPLEFDTALNVRFDRYVGETGPVAPDLAIFPPAPNIVQGRRLESCASPPGGGEIYPPYRLPRDAAYSGLRLSGFWDQGGGDWTVAPPFGGTGASFGTALEEYLAWNHGDKGQAVRDRLRTSRTRYELYLRELGLTPQTDSQPVDTRSFGPARATMPTGGPRSGPLAVRSESPVPVCYAGPGRPTDPRRRIVYLAVADCGAFPAAATASNLSRHVAKFFLTEPSERGAILAEFVGMIRPPVDDGKLRHVVQLVDTR